MKIYGVRGRDGWYINPSLKHYRYYRCINSSSNQPIDADNVKLIPQNFSFPSVTADDYMNQAATYILHILPNKNNKIRFLNFRNPTTNDFIQFTQILKRSITPIEYTKPFTVVPESDHVSSPRVTHNIAPSEMVQHRTMVPLVVPKNIPISSPRMHQIAVTPLEAAWHNSRVKLTAFKNNPLSSLRVHQITVAPLEMVQHNNAVPASRLHILRHAPTSRDKSPPDKKLVRSLQLQPLSNKDPCTRIENRFHTPFKTDTPNSHALASTVLQHKVLSAQVQRTIWY